MTHKKTQPTDCCTKKKQIPFFVIGAIIIILLWVIFMPTKKSYSPSINEENTELPTIEIISDTVEVQPIDTILVTDKTEVIIEPKIIKNPIMKLDVPNSVIAQPITESEKLVQVFLSSYNQKRFKDACDILVDTKCDDRIKSSVERFGEEFYKMENGYENIDIHQVDVPDFHSDVVCVEYDYRYNESTNPNTIHETMSFYIQDGKITYRICENKTRDGETIGCPIKSRRDFCLE